MISRTPLLWCDHFYMTGVMLVVSFVWDQRTLLKKIHTYNIYSAIGGVLGGQICFLT